MPRQPGLLRSWIGARRTEAQLRYESLQNHLAITRMQSRDIQEASNIFIDTESGPLFDALSYSTMDALDEGAYESMLRNQFQLWRGDPYARGWIELFVKFIVGSEARLLAKDEDPRTQAELDKFCAPQEFDDGRKEPGFTRRMNEAVRRYCIFGDVAARKFPNEFNGDIFYRFLNPFFIRATGQFPDNGSFGIVTNPQDIEHITFFTYWPQYGPSQKNIGRPSAPIPSREVVWIKSPDSLSDMKHGIPLLLPVTKDLIELKKLLQSILRRATLSALFAIQRTSKGGPQFIKDMRKANRASDGTREKAPSESGIIDMSQGTEIEIKTAALHAMDEDVNVKRKLCGICTGLGISYSAGSADSTAETYNGGDLALHPLIKTMTSMQRYLGPTFAGCGTELLKRKIAAGILPEESYETEKVVSPGMPGLSPSIIKLSKKAVARNTGVITKYADMISRDPLAEVQAMVLESQMGWIDKDTAISERGRIPQDIRDAIHFDEIESIQNGDSHSGSSAKDELITTLMSRKAKDGVTGTATNKPILAGTGKNGNGSRH